MKKSKLDDIGSVCRRNFYFITSALSGISKYCKVMKEVIRKEPETPSDVMEKILTS